MGENLQLGLIMQFIAVQSVFQLDLEFQGVWEHPSNLWIDGIISGEKAQKSYCFKRPSPSLPRPIKMVQEWRKDAVYTVLSFSTLCIVTE